MISTKARNSIVALVASLGVAGTAVVPTVAQAQPPLKKVQVTCPAWGAGGTGVPGEEQIEYHNEVDANGNLVTVKEDKICGLDGKWHNVVDLVSSPVSLVGTATTGTMLSLPR